MDMADWALLGLGILIGYWGYRNFAKDGKPY